MVFVGSSLSMPSLATISFSSTSAGSLGFGADPIVYDVGSGAGGSGANGLEGGLLTAP